MTNESIPIASSKAGISAPQGTASRTRVLLHGPIVLTLLRLGPPNIVVNVVLIAVTASVDAHFIGRFGPNALAGISLVFPLIMLMQQVANSSMGGAIAAAVARAIGAASTHVWHWAITRARYHRCWHRHGVLVHRIQPGPRLVYRLRTDFRRDVLSRRSADAAPFW
jgi:hypothetical protein